MPNQDRNSQNGVQGTSYLFDFGTSPNTRTAVSQKVRILAPLYGEKAALSQMGVLGNFSKQESKNLEAVRGIGFGDRIAEVVTGVTEPMSLSLERALLYLCNLWQSTGYASGVDGPVRSIRHHKWPFDMEEQMVFSTLVDADIGGANVGYRGGSGGTAGSFDGGVRAIQFPEVTPDNAGKPGSERGHSALVTIYEACYFSSYSTSYSKDSAAVMESGDAQCTDVHDFASSYGEFLATGNDPTIGQLGSLRYAEGGFRSARASTVIGGGGTANPFAG